MQTCGYNMADSYAVAGTWNYRPCGKSAIEVWDETTCRWRYFCAEHLKSLENSYDVYDDTRKVIKRRKQ